jgi:GAF domain-containing protein
MDTSPLMSVQEASTDISMEEITAELDSYLSGSGHAPSGASRLSTEDLNSASMPETSEAYMADRIWDIATKMVEKSSPLKHPSLMQDPLKVDDALDRIERHVKFSEEAELKTFPIPRKSYRKTPRGRKKPPASYMSPTYNSFQKANETAAERLGALHEAKRGADYKRNQMALEKVKLERVYDRTLDELEQSKRKQESTRKELGVRRNQVEALKHENQTLRDSMRKSFYGSDKWKQKAIEVTKSLQKHAKKLSFENVNLKQKVSLLKESSAELKKYNKEVTILGEKVKELEIENKTARLEKGACVKKLAAEQKQSSHTRYLLQLEKKSVGDAKQALEEFKSKHKILNKAYNEQAHELVARTSEMRAENDVVKGQLKRFQARLRNMAKHRNSGLEGLQPKVLLMQSMIGGFQSWNSPSETYRGIDFMARQITQSATAKLYLLDKASSTLYRPGRFPDEPEERVPLGSGFVGDVALTGQTLRLERAEADKRYLTSDISTDSNGGTALLCTALAVEENGFVGAIQVTKDYGDAVVENGDDTVSGGYVLEDEVALQQVALLASMAAQFWHHFGTVQKCTNEENERLKNISVSLKKQLEQTTERVHGKFAQGYVTVEEMDLNRAKHRTEVAQLKKALKNEKSKYEQLREQLEGAYEETKFEKLKQEEFEKTIGKQNSLLSKNDGETRTLEQKIAGTKLKLEKVQHEKEIMSKAYTDEIKQLEQKLLEAGEKAKEWQNAKESLENEANLHSNFRDNFSHLVAEGSIQRLMNTVIAHSRELLEAERASLFLYDEESNELWSQVAEGIDEEIRISADSGLAGACFRSKKVVNVKEALKDPRFVSSIDYQTGFQTKGVLVAPVFNKEGDKVIGIIEALNKITGESKCFSAHDEALIREFSKHLGVTVTHVHQVASVGNDYDILVAEMHEKIQASAHTIARKDVELNSMAEKKRLHQAVIDISITLVEVKDVDKVFSSITKAARELVGAERATLFLANEESKVLWSKVAEGASGRIEVPFEKGIVGDSFKNNASVKVDDASTDPRFHGKNNSAFQTRSVLCATVHAGPGKKYGVLQALNKVDGTMFSERDLNILEEFANEIGTVVQNWMMYFHTVQRMQVQLEAAIDSESKMADLIRFVLDAGGQPLNTNLQTSGGVSVEDILGMLPEPHVISRPNSRMEEEPDE